MSAANTTTATATTTQQESVPVAPASTQGEKKFMEHIFSETMPDGSKRGLTYGEWRDLNDTNLRDAPASSVRPGLEFLPCTAFDHLMDEPNRIAANIWSTQGEKKFMEHIFSETMPDGSKRGLTYAEMRERYG